jgi:hypothetical protein
MSKRTVIVGSALVIAIAAGGTAFYLRRLNQRQVASIAAKLTGCPVDRVDVVSSDGLVSDTETYDVMACGRHVVLICGAPDFQCFVDSVAPGSSEPPPPPPDESRSAMPLQRP